MLKLRLLICKLLLGNIILPQRFGIDVKFQTLMKPPRNENWEEPMTKLPLFMNIFLAS